MNADHQAQLIAAARAIDAGASIDWAEAESAGASESYAALLRELKIIADIATLHRSLPPSVNPGESANLLEADDLGGQSPGLATWGSLTLLERIGHGAFGEVYRARDPRLDRHVALKLLRRTEPGNRPRAAIVVDEGRLLARVRHPNVVTVYGADQVNDRIGLWMEFIDGRTLADEVRTNGPLPISDAAQIGISVCRALSAVHQAGLIHRDLKAQNVMREAGGRIVLMDFGSVHESGAGGPAELTGTPLYLAPEIFLSQPATVRSDIFSVGVLLFHLVTGTYPVPARTLADIREAHTARRRRSLRDACADVPPAFAAVIERALEFDPERRYASAEAMETALKETITSQRSDAEAAAHASMLGGDRRVRQGIRVAGLMLLVAIGVAAATQALWRPAKTLQSGSSIGSSGRAAPGEHAGFSSSSLLTDRDVIMIAEFDNTTGDSVFDVVLREAISIQLGQSPFFNIVSDARIRETLRLMERAEDTPLTQPIAREVCERLGLKAVLGGAIAPIGNHYAVTLTATNCLTEEALDREQREAASKEHVLAELNLAAASLRRRLGESLASIERFVPPDEWRTSSLDALRAFTDGRVLHGKGKSSQAIPHLLRAIELDPRLAGAHRELGMAYIYIGQARLGREALTKAYELRERGTEYQRQFITATYFRQTVGNREKARDASEFWFRNFPDFGTPALYGGLEYADVGRFEDGLRLVRESIRLGIPLGHNGGSQLVNILRSLNRFADAKATIAQAEKSKSETALMHSTLYAIAFIEGDERVMQGEVDWAKGKDTEHAMIANQAAAAAFSGKLRESRQLQRHAMDLASRAELDEVVAEYRSSQAVVEALVGNNQQVVEEHLRFHALLSGNTPFALALAGHDSAARRSIDQYRKELPENTLLSEILLPTALAALEIQAGRESKAIEILEPARHFEPAASALRAAYTRGLAYLSLGTGEKAAAEFRKVLDHRGVLPLSVLYPLSQLGVARAYALSSGIIGPIPTSRSPHAGPTGTPFGNPADALKAYQDFFAMWNEADPDIPVMVQARREYARLSNLKP
jgi:tetratricopeptide (TPR) repeat protein